MTEKIFLALAALGLVATSPCIAKSGSETQRMAVLQACEAEFGAPVDRERGFFEVDRYFVLEAKFDENGALTQLGVLPKHWFGDAHPEWDETTDVGEMTQTQYESLLRRLDAIRQKGALSEKDPQPVVKPMVLQRRDIYEHAVVVTGDVMDDTRPEDAPRTIKYFVVYFNPEM